MQYVDVPSKNLMHEFEKKNSLPIGFFGTLYQDDDWSFIIKLSALFEAVCTEILTKALKRKELREVFSRIEIGNQQYGKLVFLSSMKIIDRNAQHFISKIASLRNAFVHDISKTKATLKDHFYKMEASTKNEYVKHLTFYLPEFFSQKKYKMSASEYLLEKPVEAIWVASSVCLINGELLLKQSDLNVKRIRI